MINMGFVCIGQGGGNMGDVFASEFPTIAVNTAKQDLAGLSNIPEDLKVFARVTDGGAGKRAKIGEYAVRTYKKTILDKVEMVMRDVDLIWVLVGLGGGSGSLGAGQLVQQIVKAGKDVGVVATLPIQDMEGTHEKVNALLGLDALMKLQAQLSKFKGVLFVDNQRLKKRVLEKGNCSYEEFWEKGNQIIYDEFFAMTEYLSKSSMKNVDQEDFKNVLLEKGCLYMTESIFEIDSSDTALASKVKDSWSTKDSIFLAGDPAEATGYAVVIDRPEDFDQDGKQIHRLFEELKNTIKAGFFAPGVYSGGGKWYKKLKETFTGRPIKVFTLLSGLPFPTQKIEELKGQVEQEMQEIKRKQKRSPGIEIDVEHLKDFVEVKSSGADPDFDFSVFEHRQDDKEKLEWNL